MSFAPPPPRFVPPGPQVSALGGCVPAAPGRRAGAAVLDSLILSVPAGAASACTTLGTVQETTALVVVGGVLALLVLAGLVVVGVGFARTGLTPGKRAMGLRLVDARTGGAPGFAGTWWRYVLVGFGSAVVVGWVMAVVQVLRDVPGDRRTWYDSATDVALLDVVAGRDPADDLAARRAEARPAPAPAAASFAGEPAPRLAAVPTLVTMDGAPLHPVDVAPAQPATAPVPPPPASVDDADDLDETRATVDLRPGTAGAEPPPVALLTFDSGVAEEVTGRALVGRRPRLADGAEGTLLTVDDDTRTVSKTHLELVVERDGVRVTDLWSTNGSTVVDADGDAVPLDAGSPLLAVYGSTVTVGDHWFTVSRVLSERDAFDDAGDTILRGPR